MIINTSVNMFSEMTDLDDIASSMFAECAACAAEISSIGYMMDTLSEATVVDADGKVIHQDMKDRLGDWKNKIIGLINKARTAIINAFEKLADTLKDKFTEFINRYKVVGGLVSAMNNKLYISESEWAKSTFVKMEDKYTMPNVGDLLLFTDFFNNVYKKSSQLFEKVGDCRIIIDEYIEKKFKPLDGKEVSVATAANNVVENMTAACISGANLSEAKKQANKSFDDLVKTVKSYGEKEEQEMISAAIKSNSYVAKDIYKLSIDIVNANIKMLRSLVSMSKAAGVQSHTKEYTDSVKNKAKAVAGEAKDKAVNKAKDLSGKFKNRSNVGAATV